MQKVAQIQPAWAAGPASRAGSTMATPPEGFNNALLRVLQLAQLAATLPPPAPGQQQQRANLLAAAAAASAGPPRPTLALAPALALAGPSPPAPAAALARAASADHKAGGVVVPAALGADMPAAVAGLKVRRRPRESSAALVCPLGHLIDLCALSSPLHPPSRPRAPLAQLPVSCNDIRGTVYLDQQVVACFCSSCEARVAGGHGRPLFSFTRFERHSGSKVGALLAAGPAAGRP